MTVALVLAAEADAGMCGQLAALGVRRVDLAGSGSNGAGLLTVAAAARTAGEKVIICVGEGPVPGEVLARLLACDGTAVYNGGHGRNPGALVVATPDLVALSAAAESLATTTTTTAAAAAATAAAATAAGAAATAASATAVATVAGPDAGAGRNRTDPLGAMVTELARRGVTTSVLDAGLDGDGAVAQQLADPFAQDITRWALARELTPDGLCGISLGLGVIAAIWFTSGTLAADAVAVPALAASFVTGRAASLVAASGRWASPAIDWLVAATGLLAELGSYAALAQASTGGIFGRQLQGTFIGTLAGSGSRGVWHLALAAMGLLVIRRLAELCFDRSAEEHGMQRTVLRRLEQTVTLPAGERYLVLVVVVPLAGPRLAFAILLGWGTIALAYLLTGKVVGSALVTAVAGPTTARAGAGPADGPAGSDPRPIGDIAAYRNDGMLAHWVGGIVQGRLPPLLPAVTGVIVTAVLAALGMANLPGILILTPVEAMLLAALGACHPHDGRRDWLVPPLLMAGEYLYLAAIGLAHGVPMPVLFALLAAIALRHIDVAYRAKHYAGISADLFGLGWDGRMLLLGLAVMLGIGPLAYVVFSGYLWVLFAWDYAGGWLADSDANRQEAER